MITIVDYKMGNLLSIQNMLKKIGYESTITSDPEKIKIASKLILPGVGSYATAMNSIMDLNIQDSLNVAVLEDKKPILGICLGMQLMCTKSEEGDGITNGLNWIDASVLRLPNVFDSNKIKIPHIGWSEIDVQKETDLFIKDVSNKFYFVHAYYVDLNDKSDALTTTKYGIEYCSSFQKGNLIGVQFHPEKSHKYGMHLFSKFASM
jgi:glutamine amidotransferase